MSTRLTDAADLLKMLELVFNQRGQNDSDQFPWTGVKLTLRQARELVLEAAQQEASYSREERTREERREERSQPERRQSHPLNTQPLNDKAANQRSSESSLAPLSEGSRVRESSREETRRPAPTRANNQLKEPTLTNSAEAPFRGTFNRIQLTEETVETREEQTATTL